MKPRVELFALTAVRTTDRRISHKKRVKCRRLGQLQDAGIVVPCAKRAQAWQAGHGLGTLGRDTFRGPAYYDFDFSLSKDTSFGTRGKQEYWEYCSSEQSFFNIFNIVNFGLPNNAVRGTGFGIVSKTAGTSRQIQLSLKVIY